jgi:hypothetical protein
MREIQSASGAPPHPGPLCIVDAQKFTSSIYALVKTVRPLTIYRFYETSNLQAPYGREHNSFISGHVKKRVPAKMLGGWWSCKRPSLTIDNLGYSDEHRKDDRAGMAVLKEWNRFDVCVEAILKTASLVYVGRTAQQAENVSFETDHGRTILYAGGAIQFLLVRPELHISPFNTNIMSDS